MTEKQAKGILMTAMSIFGTIGIFVHYITLPSSLIAFIRGLIGMLFLVFLVRYRKEVLSKDAIRKNFLPLSIAGALNGFNWILLFEAYRYSSVAVATLCYYLAPIFMTLASVVLFQEKISKYKVLCIGTALLGMAFIAGVFEQGATKGSSLKGIFFGLSAAVLYACIIIINKFLHNISASERTIVQLGSSSLVLLPYVLWSSDWKSLNFSVLSLVLVFILGSIHTGLAYAMYFSCLHSLKTQTIAIFSYLDPILAIFLSALFLGEKLSFSGLIGAILILASTFFSEFLDREKN